MRKPLSGRIAVLSEPAPGVRDGALEVALGEVQLGAGSSGAEVMRQFAHGHADRIDDGLLTSEPPPEAGCTTEEPGASGRGSAEGPAPSDDSGNPSPGIDVYEVLAAQDVAPTHLPSFQCGIDPHRRDAHVQKAVPAARGEKRPPLGDL